MFGIHDFALFLAMGIALNLTPGPDTLYILGRSLAQGRQAGLASALGIGTGALCHTVAAATGLTAMLAAVPSVFLAIKLLGAAYLVYLGLRMLLSRAPALAVPVGFTSSGFAAVFRQGVATNLLNPKVALFYLAFVPQFIAADSPSKFLAFMTLGLCFAATGTVWSLCVAWCSSGLGAHLRGSAVFAHWLNKTAGALFILLGLRLASTD